MKKQEKMAELESSGRRKAVKTIVGGVTAVAAYNFLPAKWGVPVIESIFVPVHAATSGTVVGDPCSVTITSGDQSTQVAFTVAGFVTPAVSGLPVNIEITTTGGGNAGVSQYPSTLTGLFTDANGQFSLDLGQWAVGTQRIDAVTRVEGASGEGQCHANVPAAQPSCCGAEGTIVLGANTRVYNVTWHTCAGGTPSDSGLAGDTITLTDVDITQPIELTIEATDTLVGATNINFVPGMGLGLYTGTVQSCDAFSVNIVDFN